jgi:integrase/recombinase XerD
MNPNTEILAKVVLDPRRSLKHTDEKNNPLYPVKLRITFLRQRRYYDIGIDPLSAKDFEKIESGNRNTKSLRDIYKDIIKAENEANEIISKLEPFSFNEFKRLLNGPVPTTYSSFHKAFQEYIKELRKQGRIGTANSYNNALTSLISFKKSIHWNDLTPNFLNDYEKSMISKKKDSEYDWYLYAIIKSSYQLWNKYRSNGTSAISLR